MKKYICFILVLTVLLSMLVACKSADAETTEATDSGKSFVQQEPLEVPQADNLQGKGTDDTFESAYMTLAVDLLQRAAAEKDGENTLISPLSIQLALAMTANGAAGKTLEEMETVLGQNIPLDELNLYLLGYLHDYDSGLTRDELCKLQIANSVWLRDNADKLQVKEEFLQSVSNYYNAEIYKSAFNHDTVKQINDWANQKTDGMIPEILEKIDENSMLYLINAITFDANWAHPYVDFAIQDGEFYALSGEKQIVSMMHGGEGLYLEDNRATGFIKPYEGGRFGFAVLLPNAGTDVYTYMNGLTADSLAQTLKEVQQCKVVTQLPSFSYDFELQMNDVLKKMGMPTAFDPNVANLTALGTSSDGNLYIGNVLHKTFIRVDGQGTQAGAITMIEVPAGAAMPEEEEIKEVIVDRPFVYMILDMETSLPLFIGCVTEVTE